MCKPRTQVTILAQRIIDPVGKGEPMIETRVLDPIEQLELRKADAESQKKASKPESVFVSNSPGHQIRM